ncbi:MAG: sigma-70 family RNA polymerase sigma factor [Bacteroidota bacterium]
MGRIRSDIENEELLLSQIRLGCKDSFNTLYNLYWHVAYSNAFKRLKDSDQAKDVVQEIFIKIWFSDTVISNFPAYLNTAVRNQVFRLIAEQKKTSPFMDMLHDIPSLKGADSNIISEEFYKLYDAFISSLPPKRQHIFRLHFNENLTTKVIAEQMGISRKTVQNQLGKAIEQLKITLLPSFIIIISSISQAIHFCSL